MLLAGPKVANCFDALKNLRGLRLKLAGTFCKLACNLDDDGLTIGVFPIFDNLVFANLFRLLI